MTAARIPPLRPHRGASLGDAAPSMRAASSLPLLSATRWNLKPLIPGILDAASRIAAMMLLLYALRLAAAPLASALSPASSSSSSSSGDSCTPVHLASSFLLTADASVICDAQGEMHMFDDADPFPSSAHRAARRASSELKPAAREPPGNAANDSFRSAAAACTRAFHSFTQKVGDVITASHLPPSTSAAGARSRARSDAELAASRIRPRSRVPPWVQRLQESYHMHATVMSPRSVSVLTAQAHFGLLFPIIIARLLFICCGAGLLGLMRRKRQQKEAEAKERRRRSAAAWATALPGAALAGIQMPLIGR